MMQVIVLGMHRCGTSMIARILNLMGCYFGPEDVSLGAAFDNPKGFWERKDVVSINDHILDLAGGNWWKVDSLKFDSISPDDKKLVYQSIADIVLKMDGHRPWFIKDPRLCLTLDFWLPALECPVFVFAHRNPLQAAQSLEKRNNIPLEYSLLLWEFYMRSMLESIKDKNYILADYESVIDKPYEETVKIYELLADSGVYGLKKPSQNETEKYVDSLLFHYRDKKAGNGLTLHQKELLDAINKRQPDNAWPQGRKTELCNELNLVKNRGVWEKAMTVPERLPNIEKTKEIQAYNEELKKRNDEMVLRLTSVSRSRLVRFVSIISRIFYGGGKGLAAELKRIEKFLFMANQNGKTLVNRDETSIMGRVFRIIQGNPLLVLKIIHPRSLINAFLLLKEYKGNLGRLIMRLEQLCSQSPQDFQTLLSDQIYSLISLYDLPRSMKEKSSNSPDDRQVNDWVIELKRLTEKITENSAVPEVSIIIPVHNQIRFTLACLHSLYANISINDCEILISDDNSTDQTSEVFKNNFPRLKYSRNTGKDLGFVNNCNRAALMARGRYLIFLNNDVLVLPGWLEELIRTFKEQPTAGIVGSKLIYPEGLLQEAGGIVFQDGNGWNYGRYQNPWAPDFNYLRDVDYCSGASLAVLAEFWLEAGGFDKRFAPAYYEDTDLAFQARLKGRRVFYQPLSVAVHFEGVTNGKEEDSGMKQYQLINKKKFHSKWRQTLKRYGTPEPLPVNRALKGKVLVIDATTPTPDKDSGSNDAYNYMKIIQGLGFHVTFVPADRVFRDKYTRNLQRTGIEVLHSPWISSLKEAIVKYGPGVDLIIFCRVNVAAPLMDLARKYAPQTPILFDTVDLHFLRESRAAEIEGSASLLAKAAKIREAELGVIKKANATILRSEYEKDLIKKIIPDARLFIFPLVREIPGPSTVQWKDRKNIVFLGGFSHPPNADAVKFFVSDVWPLLGASGFSEKLIIAGSDPPEEILSLASKDIIISGFIPDLSTIFDGCKISIAPLRYGAGVKGKVVTSLSYGVPCVATEIAVEGSGLVHNKDILVAKSDMEMAELIKKLCSDENLWQKLSQAGLLYCEERCSFSATEKIIENALEELIKQKISHAA